MKYFQDNTDVGASLEFLLVRNGFYQRLDQRNSKKFKTLYWTIRTKFKINKHFSMQENFRRNTKI